jgi:hypothetical protein
MPVNNSSEDDDGLFFLQIITATMVAAQNQQTEELAMVLVEKLWNAPVEPQLERLPARLCDLIADTQQRIERLQPPQARGRNSGSGMMSWLPLTQRLDREFWQVMCGIKSLPQYRRGCVFDVIVDLGMLRYAIRPLMEID